MAAELARVWRRQLVARRKICAERERAHWSAKPECCPLGELAAPRPSFWSLRFEHGEPAAAGSGGVGAANRQSIAAHLLGARRGRCGTTAQKPAGRDVASGAFIVSLAPAGRRAAAARPRPQLGVDLASCASSSGECLPNGLAVS